MLFKQISLAVMTAMTIGTAALPAAGAMAATEQQTNSSSAVRAAEVSVVMWEDSNGEHTVTITCTLPLKQSVGDDTSTYKTYNYTDANGTQWIGQKYMP